MSKRKTAAWMRKMERTPECVWLGMQVDGARERVAVRRGPRASAPARQLMLASIGDRLAEHISMGHQSYGLLLGLISRMAEDSARAESVPAGKLVNVKPDARGAFAQVCGGGANPDVQVRWGAFDGESIVLMVAAVCVLALAEIKGEAWDNREATVSELVGALKVMTALYQEAERVTTPRFGEARPRPNAVVRRMIFAVN